MSLGVSIRQYLQPFLDRSVKATEVFTLSPIHKSDAYDFIRQYHYLGDAKFFSQYNFGLFLKDTNIMVGVATYSAPQGGNSLQGWFKLSNDDTTIVELSRLCVLPVLNGSNATSYLLSNSMKMLKKSGTRAVITLADSSRHVGSIYQVCNFKYYGLTPQRAIFYTDTNKKNPRILGKKDIHGVWVDMPQKHRYAYIMDKSLVVCHGEEPYPKKDAVADSTVCCGCKNTFTVFDNRFKEYYTCPYCFGGVYKITNEQYDELQRCKDKKTFISNIIGSTIDNVEEERLW